MAVDHADDGHAQVTPNTKRDAEANAREDGDDVAPRQTEARAVHHGQLFLLHRLWSSFCGELDGLAIFLFLLKDSVYGAERGKCKVLLARVVVSAPRPANLGRSSPVP